ncbi:hypothetical protein J3A83DRAFT_4358795 [Scleroderma citrinum]
MTNNAYFTGHDTGWYDVEGFNSSIPVGWEPTADSLRGHIFVSEDSSTVILSIKGTSAGWTTESGGPIGSGRCERECVKTSLLDEDLFYSVGLNLYNIITYIATFGAPVVAFKTPAEKLAVTQLHLPILPSTQHITHAIHTADPIAMGYMQCCRCHLGQVILYDTVTKLGWAVDIRTHTVLNLEWDNEPQEDNKENLVYQEGWGWWSGKGDDKKDQGKHKPLTDAEVDCVDCFNWEYGEWD